MGREVKADRWLKWWLIEAAWFHINWCPDGRLMKVYRNACRRKLEKKKAIKNSFPSFPILTIFMLWAFS
jgi:hypothetical protein